MDLHAQALTPKNGHLSGCSGALHTVPATCEKRGNTMATGRRAVPPITHLGNGGHPSFCHDERTPYVLVSRAETTDNAHLPQVQTDPTLSYVGS